MTIAASAPAEQGLLTEELLRRIAQEQASLTPSALVITAKQGWPDLRSIRNIPRERGVMNPVPLRPDRNFDNAVQAFTEKAVGFGDLIK